MQNTRIKSPIVCGINPAWLKVAQAKARGLQKGWEYYNELAKRRSGIFVDQWIRH